MVICDMTLEECRKVLGRESFGRLACARRNEPYIVPIEFAYQGEYLYGFSSVGQKVEWMRDDPCVCVEIDVVTSRDRWSSVIVSGHYEALPDTPESVENLLDAYELIRKRALWWQPSPHFIVTLRSLPSPPFTASASTRSLATGHSQTPLRLLQQGMAVRRKGSGERKRCYLRA